MSVSPPGPRGFSVVVAKLTSFCNLDCDYCYMFNLADTSQAALPNMMSSVTAQRLVSRIAEYDGQRGGGHRYQLVLHGGEPSLWPMGHFRDLGHAIDAARASGVAIDVGIQSNGLRPFSDEFIGWLRAMGAHMGVSLDGPRHLNDAHRVDRRGRGSYDRVLRSIGDLVTRGGGDILGGFLCVMDPSIDPVEFLDWIEQLPVTRVDLLWPIEYTPEHPPWGDAADEGAYRQRPRYGTWLTDVFFEWIRRDDPSVRIRLFDSVIGLFLGGHGHPDSLVNDAIPLFGVDTDGTYCYPDYFRVAGDSAARTDRSVHTHAVCELHTDAVFGDLLALDALLPTECGPCRFRAQCGGGFLPGRIRSSPLGVSTRPSVLCWDELAFFAAVEAVVHRFAPGREGEGDPRLRRRKTCGSVEVRVGVRPSRGEAVTAGDLPVYLGDELVE
ncbi:radical SAM protein [Tsukamurella sp. 8F]|uniref:radical SAM protein n=1 Tax=unclassified Tsukamurella TaxID=2633480 RepID=UPI0023B9AB38|nr:MULTISPECIES: radical SAM protein [unclassified Tsukamurella]MDF0531421.1 radical SAM protein [Tsukamurella sp. 8J]MDF0585273.1 radical SAM protein [Tsukamurella sp. 8F]